MLHTTRWKPDTCDCDLEYEWDDELPQEQRVHSLRVVHAACAVHAHHTTHQNHFAAVLGENQMKNIAVGLAQEHAKSIADKPDAIEWSIDGDRKVTLRLHGHTDKEHQALTNALNAKFGAKVKVER